MVVRVDGCSIDPTIASPDAICSIIPLDEVVVGTVPRRGEMVGTGWPD